MGNVQEGLSNLDVAFSSIALEVWLENNLVSLLAMFFYRRRFEDTSRSVDAPQKRERYCKIRRREYRRN
jgi:hypothetical protein